ncbi:MAG: lysine exporter LysO family protein [Thermoplasmata archaeon]
MDIDPFLYVALGLGVALGLVARPNPRWVGRGTQGAILVLLFLLGASLTDVPIGDVGPAVLLSLLLVALILAFTVAIALALPRPATARTRAAPPPPRESIGFSVALVAALFFGYGVGLAIAIPATATIEYALYVLLFLVGLGLHLIGSVLRRVWAPIVAASLGALAAGAIYSALTGLALSSSLALTFAFGWYSLDGPLVTASLGASLGLIAFLANFLRENLTMLLAPTIGPRISGEGLTAMGGATSMDTTLYFVVRYGDPDAATLALASGLILTIAASLVVPVFLALGA